MKKMALPAVLSLVVLTLMPAAAGANWANEMLNALGGKQYLNDVPASNPNYAAISLMADEGAVTGYPDGSFKPDNSVNRAELVKMIVAYNYVGVDWTNYKNCFPDVKEEWFAPYVCFAREQGLVQGYPDGTFKPGNNINRVEAIKILLPIVIPEERMPMPAAVDEAVVQPSDIDGNAWYAPYLRFSVAKGLLDGQHIQEFEGGYNYFPGGNMARKEVAEMVFRMMAYEADRAAYATVMAESTCYYLDNKDTMSEEEIKAKINEMLGKMPGYSVAEFDAMTPYLKDDDVVNADIEKGMQESCPNALGGTEDVPIGDPEGAASQEGVGG
jgi:hypothetical protein